MKVLLWAVQVLLAGLFLFAGIMKFVMPVAEMTEQIPFPGWFLHFIGLCEILGALGLILPGALKIREGLTPLAAGCLVVLMLGATVVCLKTGPLAVAFMPFVPALLAAFVVYGRLQLAGRNNFSKNVDLKVTSSIQR